MFIRIMSWFLVLVYLNRNITVNLFPPMSQARGNGPNFPYLDFVFSSWHILYMLNQFDRHELDAIVGEDPFEQDSTPKWADCDKSVTNFDDQRPVSIGKFAKLEGHGFTSFSPFWAFI